MRKRTKKKNPAKAQPLLDARKSEELLGLLLILFGLLLAIGLISYQGENPQGVTVNSVQNQLGIADKVSQARQRVVIANAYFFPGYRLLREIRNAARRGVHVQLIMQGQPDVQAAFAAYVRAVKDISFPAEEHGFSA